jgi:hypothetical protein
VEKDFAAISPMITPESKWMGTSIIINGNPTRKKMRYTKGTATMAAVMMETRRFRQ